jgi:RNA polymerase sigma-70 factor (ECF subfamily)
VDERARAIEVLHRKHAGVIYDLCVRMLGDRSEAEDAVQETFVNAFRALDSFRYGDSHLPWLYRIATNACLKIIRTRKRKGVALTDSPERMADRPQDPVREMHARQVLERLVGELDERSLEILVAHYVAGMDQGQIAASLGISRRAVVKRLTKLRRRAGHLFEEGTSDG